MTKTLHCIVTLSLSLILAGCGGGEASAACTPHVVTIGLYGDSTQAGLSRDGVTGTPYTVQDPPAALIQRAMDAAFGVGAVVVNGHGVSGQDTSMLLAGMQTFGAPWPYGAVEDIALENEGINDLSHGVTADDYRLHLTQIVQARAVVIETPLPMKGDGGFALVARSVAASTGAPLIDVAAFAAALPAWQTYTGDGTHPTETGYAVITNGAVIPALVPMAAKLRCEKTP
jgi:lysophospholipase L1-like esterase